MSEGRARLTPVTPHTWRFPRASRPAANARALLTGDPRVLMDALFASCLLIFLANTFITDAGTGWAPHELVVLHTIRSLWAGLCVLVWLRLRRNRHIGWLAAFGFLGIFGMGMGQEDMMLVVVVTAFGRFGRRAGFTVAALGVVCIMVPALLAPDYPGWQLKGVVFGQVLTSMAVPVLLGLAMHWLQTSADRLASANRQISLAVSELDARAGLTHDLALAEERARAARELHDGLGHQLTIAGMSLDYAVRALQSDPGDAWDEVKQARGLIDQALSATNAWATMAPAASATELGLPGLDAIADAFRATG